ncbi:MAG: SLBB domain-containing protein [Acidimicrobiales bacterium]
MEAEREVSRRSDAAASDGAPDDARSDDVASDAVERLRQTLNTPTRWSDHLRMRWGGGLAGRGQLPDVAEEVLGAPRLRTPPTAPGSGGIVAGVAALALLVGIVAGWLGRGAVGAAASAHDAAATPIVADGPQGPGGASTPAPVDGGSVPGEGGAGDAHGDAGAAPLAVHVAGAVARPGLYQVPASARVADVVELAGGAAADADLDRVNLAAPVADGARVFMPRVGQGEPPVPLAPMAPGPAVRRPVARTRRTARARRRWTSTGRTPPRSRRCPGSGPPWRRRSSSTAPGSGPSCRRGPPRRVGHRRCPPGPAARPRHRLAVSARTEAARRWLTGPQLVVAVVGAGRWPCVRCRPRWRARWSRSAS